MDKLLGQIKGCIAKKQRKNKVNYEQASKDMNISKSTIFNILNGNKNPTLSRLRNIIQYTGCIITCNSQGDLICLNAEKLEKNKILKK